MLPRYTAGRQRLVKGGIQKLSAQPPDHKSNTPTIKSLPLPLPQFYGHYRPAGQSALAGTPVKTWTKFYCPHDLADGN